MSKSKYKPRVRFQPPTGSICEPWFIYEDEYGLVIKRWVKLPSGKRISDRLPLGNYHHHRKDPAKLNAFLLRLNHRDKRAEAAKAKDAVRRAFVDPQILDKFEEQLKTEIATIKEVRTNISALNRYCLGFFISKLGLIDPQEWRKKDNQLKWAMALLNDTKLDDKLRLFDSKTVVPSKRLIQRIVQIANRFVAFLHESHPDEYPAIRFEPLGSNRLESHETTRKLNDPDESRGKFISESDWRLILRCKKHREILPALILAYGYGLRRAEVLGLKLEDVRKGHLHIQRQLERCPEGQDPVYGPPKDGESRKTPHWFSGAAETHELIAQIKRMHPDTFGDRWNAIMIELKLQYELHDLRRTFITRALRGYVARDVQLAVGHANIMTTMAYAQDDRDIEDEAYVPKKAGAL